ncbi:RabGAP/TBC [Artomyces pyxidatus]|uniref:RabGAP/TBC n=1 Tax=Artomyces pyxidatus TaxID=48021 RepID=A0ACB8SSL4_9AGAM|nr:RabGAP/TBC [Artomyces pyxidatus]
MAAPERGTRPSIEDVRLAYDHLFRSGLSLSKIKDAALGARLFNPGSDSTGVAGRSLAWKLFLTPSTPLHPPPELPPTSSIYLESLKVSRAEYTRLLLEKLKAPDGSYEEGFIAPGTDAPPQRKGPNSSNLERNNPLSLHDENPWKEWFAAVDLRKTISQDVERTFPDIAYFRESAVQSQLTHILFLYSVMHPAIGYRQGMHEILAPLYYAVDYDSLGDPSGLQAGSDDEMTEMCARRWVAADAWALFSSVMGAAGKWYEWRESPQEASLVPGHVNLHVPDGRVNSEPYVAPILNACNRIQRELLKSVDPALWERLQAEGIEPQIYGIRWLRLLFTREFNMHDAMVLWDGLFAVDPSLELGPWICVAMLVRIRNRLIPSDYSAQLTYLLRYPTPPTTISQPPSTPHHATLLLRQALTLQMSPSASTGAAVVYENRNLLNIPSEVPEPPPPPMRRTRRPGEAQRRQSLSGNDVPEAGPSRHHLGRSAGGQGLSEMIAKGLMDRGEALGINKTFMNAVSEIKRNLPDIAANLVRTPPAQSSGYAAYPLLDERPPEERPPWEPKTRFEIERDVAEMQVLHKRLGESVAWIVDTLLLDEGESEERAKKVRADKREALESLAYVRDVLQGNVAEVEEERLMAEEELKRRKEVRRLENERLALGSPPTSAYEHVHPISPPPPLRPAAPVAPPAHVPKPRPVAAQPVLQPPLEPPRASSFNAPRLDSPKGMASSLSAPRNAPRAPWNYTRSNFTTPGGFGAAVPTLAPLPRASTVRIPSAPSLSTYPPVAADQQGSRALTPPTKGPHDPLGVLQ